MDSHLLCLPGQRPALTAPGAAQEGHRQPAALPPPCRCPGIRQASDGPQRATGGTQRLPCPAGALASAQLQTAQEGTRCAPWRPASAPPVKSVSADGFEAPQGPAAAHLPCRVSWHPPSSDGHRRGRAALPQRTRKNRCTSAAPPPRYRVRFGHRRRSNPHAVADLAQPGHNRPLSYQAV